MRTSTATFEGAGGLRLHVQAWRPDGPPRAALAVVHGFGEHGGRYPGLVDELVGRGWAVHALDLRGHGRSPGRRGHVTAWREYREDVAAFLAHVRAGDAAGTPLFLYGHSLGGVIVLEYGLHGAGGLGGVVASAPALVPTGVRGPRLEALARIMGRIWPSFTVRLPLRPADLYRRPGDAARPRDPLLHDRLSARGAAEAMAAIAWTRAHAGEWRLPLLVVHGVADRLAGPEGSEAFVAAARAGGAPDVELRLYPGGFHQLHDDVDAGAELVDVAGWLERHLPPP